MFYTNGAINTIKFTTDKYGRNIAMLYKYELMRFVRVNYAEAEYVVLSSDLAWELAA